MSRIESCFAEQMIMNTTFSTLLLLVMNAHLRAWFAERHITCRP